MSNNNEEQGFGEAGFDDNQKQSTWKKPWKLEKNSSLVLRILPPFGSQQNNKDGWAVFYGQHFGYFGVNKKNPDKPTARPFQCILKKNYDTGEVYQACPECDKIHDKELLLEAMVARLKTEGKTEEQIEEATIAQKLWLKTHNLDRKCYANAMNGAGEFNLFKFNYALKKKLKSLMKSIQDKNEIHSLNLDSGCWFEFIRVDGFLVKDEVVAVKDQVVFPNGQKGEVLKSGAISKADQSRAVRECKDLSGLVRELNYDQIKALVECSGDPAEVDAIIGFTQKNESRHSNGSTTTSNGNGQTTKPLVAQPTAQASPTSDEEQVLLAQLAALRNKKSEIVDASVATGTTGTTPIATPDVKNMSTEQFMAMFEGGPK